MDVGSVWGTVLFVGGLLWVLRELLRLTRRHSLTGFLAPFRQRAPVTLSIAAMWMGISNGILYAFVGAWAYTGTLGQAAQQVSGSSEGPGLRLWLLAAALLAGAVFGAWHAGKFTVDRSLSRWRAYLSGGLLMGFGASLVPGGNDVLILHSLPALSPHAIPTIAAMMFGITATLLVLGLAGRDHPRVDCRGDVCRETQVTGEVAPASDATRGSGSSPDS